MTKPILLNTESELEQLLERARREQWRELILLGAETPSWYVYQLGDVLAYQLGLVIDDLPQRLATLTSLTSLHLGGNSIGAEGVRALATLSNLTSLHLWGNGIGAEGVRALATLSNLTSLHLWGNGIGAEGALALATFSHLTSLHLGGNGIGTEGARALATLSNLTSLHLGGNDIGDEGARALATLSNLTSLDLRYNNIGDEGMRAIATLSNLTSLNLWSNNIGMKGARAIATLFNLTSLDLGYNNIGTEGARAIASLSNLTSLHLGYNGIGNEGARAIASLSNLTSLHLGYNGIGNEGARALATLSNLTSLNLGENGIGTEGARALATLSNLTSLDLWDNNIGEEGARALATLSNLTSLNLGRNRIGDEGTRALATLSNLTSLYLGGNGIGDEGARALLNAWSQRSNVQHLALQGNHLESLPLPTETLASSDAQAILAAWRAVLAAKEQNQLRPLNEAKLLVVGNEAVGKTSLVRYLTTGNARDLDEKKTIGAKIHDRIQISALSSAASDRKVNIWDFGGQEIMHGTHRYFLTHRSLYLLVLEDRREDNCPVQDWLHTIANRGGDSPVLVLINKSDQGQEMLLLEREKLKRENPGIVAFHRTSCNEDEWAKNSIQVLRALIDKTIREDKRLEKIREPVPASWLWVKNEITKAASDQKILSLSDFEFLCGRVPETERASDDDLCNAHERRALLQLLHDLGVIVAYGFKPGDLEVKSDTLLLDPNWLTGAVYTILTHKELQQQQGIFHKAQLNQWLDPNLYSPERHEYILKMMQEEDLGLCFPLYGTSDQFLVPEGLPVEGPYDETFYQAGCLRFRYHYRKLLPSGLIPRFIVAEHAKLEQPRICWRLGAVFKAAECRVLVSADRNKRLVEMSVQGPPNRQRDALNIIRDALDRVHEYQGDLGVESRVPLPDQPDVDESYNHLVMLETKKGRDYVYWPTGAAKEYKVSDLLDGVRSEKRDAPRDHANLQAPINLNGCHGVTIVQQGTGTIAHTTNTPTVHPSVPPEAEPQKNRFSRFSSWPVFAVSCGMGAVLFAVLLYFLPVAWRMWVGGLGALFLIVTTFVLMRNPDYYYRRWFPFVFYLGGFAITSGSSLDILVGQNQLHWNNGVSAVFWAAWAIVIAALVWGDSQQNGQRRK